MFSIESPALGLTSPSLFNNSKETNAYPMETVVDFDYDLVRKGISTLKNKIVIHYHELRAQRSLSISGYQIEIYPRFFVF